MKRILIFLSFVLACFKGFSQNLQSIIWISPKNLDGVNEINKFYIENNQKLHLKIGLSSSYLKLNNYENNQSNELIDLLKNSFSSNVTITEESPYTINRGTQDDI